MKAAGGLEPLEPPNLQKAAELLARRYRRLNIGALIVGFVLLVGATAFAVYESQEVSEATTAVTETMNRKAAAARVLSLLRDAETGQRGYLLTGDDSYLEPYQQAVATFEQELAGLERLVAPESESAAALSTLRQQAALKFAELDRTIDLVGAGRRNEALDVVNSDEGQRLMIALRGDIEAFQSLEDAALTGQLADLEANRRTLNLVLAIALVGALGLGLASYLLTRRYISELQMSRAELADLNRDLDARVRAQTADLSLARDRADRERQRVEVLLQDLSHRVGNNLAMISSLLALQISKVESAEAREALEEARGRLAAVATAQRRLRLGDDLESVDLKPLLEDVLEDIFESAPVENIEMSADIASMNIHSRDAVTLAVVVSELVMNALKHAFPDNRPGTIDVAFSVNDQGVPVLAVSDNGVGAGIKASRKGGLGSTVISRLSNQFGATLEQTSAPDEGTVVTLTFSKLKLIAAKLGDANGKMDYVDVKSE